MVVHARLKTHTGAAASPPPRTPVNHSRRHSLVSSTVSLSLFLHFTFTLYCCCSRPRGKIWVYKQAFHPPTAHQRWVPFPVLRQSQDAQIYTRSNRRASLNTIVWACPPPFAPLCLVDTRSCTHTHTHTRRVQTVSFLNKVIAHR